MQTLLNKLRSFKHFNLCLGIVAFLVGVLTLIFPDVALQAVGVVLGIFFLFLGVYRMIVLFTSREQGVLFYVGFLTNVFFLFCAFALLLYAGKVASLVCTLCGLYLIVNASVLLFELLSHERVRNASFWVQLILESLPLIFGLALVLAPSALVNTTVRLLGVALIAEGISLAVRSFLRHKDAKSGSDPTGPIETNFTDKSEK